MNGKIQGTQCKPKRLTLVVMAISVFAFLSLSSVARAADQFSLCKLQQEVRTLRIESAAGKCQTIYNKYGKDQNVGESANPASCEGILGRIRATLENAGWRCRAVQSSGLTDLTSTGVE